MKIINTKEASLDVKYSLVIGSRGFIIATLHFDTIKKISLIYRLFEMIDSQFSRFHAVTKQ